MYMVKNNREWTSRRIDELRQDTRMIRGDALKADKNHQEEDKLKGRLEQLEVKVDKAVESVLPMAAKMEEAKQRYEEMLRVVATASTHFSGERETSMNKIYIGRGRMNQSQIIEEGEEEGGEMEEGSGPA